MIGPYLKNIFKLIQSFDEIEYNRLGDVNSQMISFTGCGKGIDHRGEIGVTSNRTSFGEYFNDESQLVIRENCGDNIESGKLP